MSRKIRETRGRSDVSVTCSKNYRLLLLKMTMWRLARGFVLSSFYFGVRSASALAHRRARTPLSAAAVPDVPDNAAPAGRREGTGPYPISFLTTSAARIFDWALSGAGASASAPEAAQADASQPLPHQHATASAAPSIAEGADPGGTAKPAAEGARADEPEETAASVGAPADIVAAAENEKSGSTTPSSASASETDFDLAAVVSRLQRVTANNPALPLPADDEARQELLTRAARIVAEQISRQFQAGGGGRMARRFGDEATFAEQLRQEAAAMMSTNSNSPASSQHSSPVAQLARGPGVRAGDVEVEHEEEEAGGSPGAQEPGAADHVLVEDDTVATEDEEDVDDDPLVAAYQREAEEARVDAQINKDDAAATAASTSAAAAPEGSCSSVAAPPACRVSLGTFLRSFLPRSRTAGGSGAASSSSAKMATSAPGGAALGPTTKTLNSTKPTSSFTTSNQPGRWYAGTAEEMREMKERLEAAHDNWFRMQGPPREIEYAEGKEQGQLNAWKKLDARMKEFEEGQRADKELQRQRQEKATASSSASSSKHEEPAPTVGGAVELPRQDAAEDRELQRAIESDRRNREDQAVLNAQTVAASQAFRFAGGSSSRMFRVDYPESHVSDLLRNAPGGKRRLYRNFLYQRHEASGASSESEGERDGGGGGDKQHDPVHVLDREQDAALEMPAYYVNHADHRRREQEADCLEAQQMPNCSSGAASSASGDLTPGAASGSRNLMRTGAGVVVSPLAINNIPNYKIKNRDMKFLMDEADCEHAEELVREGWVMLTVQSALNGEMLCPPLQVHERTRVSDVFQYLDDANPERRRWTRKWLLELPRSAGDSDAANEEDRHFGHSSSSSSSLLRRSPRSPTRGLGDTPSSSDASRSRTASSRDIHASDLELDSQVGSGSSSRSTSKNAYALALPDDETVGGRSRDRSRESRSRSPLAAAGRSEDFCTTSPTSTSRTPGGFILPQTTSRCTGSTVDLVPVSPDQIVSSFVSLVAERTGARPDVLRIREVREARRILRAKRGAWKEEEEGDPLLAFLDGEEDSDYEGEDDEIEMADDEDYDEGDEAESEEEAVEEDEEVEPAAEENREEQHQTRDA